MLENNLLSYVDFIENIQQSDFNSRSNNFEARWFDIMNSLLEYEGYTIRKNVLTRDIGLDLIADKKIDSATLYSLGIEIKLTERWNPQMLENSLNRLSLSGINRSILLITADIEQTLRNNWVQKYSNNIEILGPSDVKKWLLQAINNSASTQSSFNLLNKVYSEIVRLIAADPTAINNLEWRDMERTLAEAFRGCGFDVELTQASKDGGKDLILKYNHKGKTRVYYVEVKHWRAGNKVGQKTIDKFLHVIITEGIDAGLMISTSGYTQPVFQGLTNFSQQKLLLGDSKQVHTLARTYVKAKAGIWSPPEDLEPTILL